jgi:hypothetical protein
MRDYTHADADAYRLISRSSAQLSFLGNYGPSTIDASSSLPLLNYNHQFEITMESVNIPSETVPPEMKACEQILKRAKELKKPEPVVAYWCECLSSTASERSARNPN